MIACPKHPLANSRYRRRIIERADLDETFREECWIRAARDLIWYVDTFGFTYSPKDHPECPHQPFVTWSCQERGLKQMDAAIGKHAMVGEKSRDMGFTWMVIALAEWRFHFHPDQSFLFGSRKEEYVDKKGDPKCLFWKLDYFIEKQPGWLQPYCDRTQLHYANLDNGSTIDGESTNDDFARGDRRGAIFLDEFPKVKNGHKIEEACGDATNCPIYFGTSSGAYGAFFDIRTRIEATNPDWLIRLHWSEHPLKKLGLYTSEKQPDATYKLRILDLDYKFPPNYKFALDGKLRSIAYDKREAQAPNKRVMAREWDIDYFASACQWFDAERLKSIKEASVAQPTAVGNILFDPDWKHPRWSRSERGGKIKLWIDFEKDEDGEPIVEIPKSWNDIVGACDISLGTAGEYSSNSVASFYRRSTGRKIAQYTTNEESPTEFCRRVLALCTFFNNAYLGWEKNGPGNLFTSQVKKSGYRNVYYSDKNLEKFVDEKTSLPGWHSDKDSKQILLEDYANALIDGTIINCCAEALDELAQYVYEGNGQILHSRSISQGKDSDDPTQVGENHGDMVIADALANFLIQDLTKREIEQPPEEQPPPARSFGARSIAAKKAIENESRRSSRWGDFRRHRRGVTRQEAMNELL
jgi:hypothetical protein